MAASLEEITEGRNCRRRVELVKGEYSKVNSLQKQMGVKVFPEWKASRKVEVPVLDPAGALKDYCELHKVQPLSTDLESMDACSLNYWFSKFVQEVVNAEEER